MTEKIFRYAITRKPGENFSKGLTTNLGRPDYKLALEQHAHYCQVLRDCGLQINILENDPQYPDCPFVEDIALITEQCAVITNPGDPSRRGEAKSIRDILVNFRALEFIQEPGTVEGGDILRIDNHFYIGISKRTNKKGALQLSAILSNYGYTSSTIPVTSVLHLKTSVTYIGNNTIVATDEFIKKDEFRNLRKIRVDDSESYSANCLMVNGYLLMPQGFPKTKDKVQRLGFVIKELEMSEFRKMDGGITCLSLLY